MDANSNEGWLPPEGALNVQPYSAANDYRTFIQSIRLLDESDVQYSPQIVVQGRQYLDGRIERWVSAFTLNGVEMSGADAARLAELLAAAADELAKYPSYEQGPLQTGDANPTGFFDLSD